MTLEVTVDRDVCIGSGNCVRLAKGVFALDEERVAVVRDPKGASDERLAIAQRSCPSGAILVKESPAGSD